MDSEKELTTRQSEDNSKTEDTDSIYALPPEHRSLLNERLLAMRVRKFRQIKRLEAGMGWGDMPGAAREYHSSALEDGVKVDQTADCDVVALGGAEGSDLAFVEREGPEPGGTELEDPDGVPAC